MKVFQSVISLLLVAAFFLGGYYFFILGSVSHRVDEQERKIEAVDGKTVEIRARVSAQGEALNATQATVTEHTQRLEKVEKEIVVVEKALRAAESSLAEAKGLATDASERVGNLEAQINALKEARERLFGELDSERRERLRVDQEVEKRLRALEVHLGGPQVPAP